MILIVVLSLALILGVVDLADAVRSNNQARMSYALAECPFDLTLAQAYARHDVVQGMCPSVKVAE